MTTDVTSVDLARAEGVEEPDHVGNRAFGFWVYLMTDLVLFAALFATYVVVRRNYAGGPTAADLFELSYTFVETLVLLSASVAYGLVTLAMHRERRRLVLAGLGCTFLLGVGFIAMEVHEFRGMILEGAGPDRSAFLSAFFTLVGTHGTHVALGLVWMAVMTGQVAVKGLTTPVRSRLLRLGMFWHFLDVVWIGIFTFVYLMGVL